MPKQKKSNFDSKKLNFAECDEKPRIEHKKEDIFKAFAPSPMLGTISPSFLGWHSGGSSKREMASCL